MRFAHTVLDSQTAGILVDGDHWDQEVTLADPKGFQVGDGVRLVSKDPHRNRFERNRIVDSGGEKGVAIDINGETESILLIRNELQETREPLSRTGIFIGAETSDVRCVDHQIEGFAIPIADQRKA